MSQLKDKYDLTQPSLSGKPGLETFRRKKDGAYFFHVNDKKGAAFLFSQGYDSAETRDKGWQSVLKNAPERKRYEIKTEQNQFFFVLKAGNNQEIARSRLFDSKLALDKAVEFLMGLQAEPLPAAPKPAPAASGEVDELARMKSLWEAEREDKERLDAEMKKLTQQLAEMKKDLQKSKTGKSAQPPATAPQSGKDAFRLEFYHEKDEAVRGRIEHLLSGAKQTFQGWDWKGILQFIGGHVGETVNISTVETPAQAEPLGEIADVAIVETPAQAAPSSEIAAAPSSEIAGVAIVETPTQALPASETAQPAEAPEQPATMPSSARGTKTTSEKTGENQGKENEPLLETAALLAQPPAGTGRFKLQFNEKGEPMLLDVDGTTKPLAELSKMASTAPPKAPAAIESQPPVAAEPAPKMEEPLEEMTVEMQAAPDAAPGLNFRAGQPLFFRFSAGDKDLGFDPTGKDVDLEIFLKPLSGSPQASFQQGTLARLRRSPDGRPFISGIPHLGSFRLLTIAHTRDAGAHFQGHALVNVY